MAYANCNWWQYSKNVYRIGRSVSAKSYANAEKTAIITFIEAIIASRPALVQRLNLKKGSVEELSKQNEYALGKMVQLIGRQLKVLPPTEEEKTLCDALFTAAAIGRVAGWGAIDSTEEEIETAPEEDSVENERIEEQTETEVQE